MTTRIRTAFTAALARHTANHTARRLAGIRFCDGCAQVCDASCRAEAHRQRAQSALTFAR
ncbi:hypothetical protein [Streptomyces antibioticus]|uniref:Uncharacterized protein n=1 Tax=Streptomyces antibioticus TaxID=1890 RepID=A0AAE7CPA1_STRAT|nr:hypothetical protein [Streptomyces antibioticus]MBO7939242.1 hypothetical protein [Streptomyces sp. S9]MCX4740877.1 hypothetical protein [Streptomyces antibioticus]OOQ48492.1 hypothetical protein AFM16_37455 [Streptomyces antibioticus]QIT48606.1 hypothetical protein HCX60_38080 [Streptomyces antibioticus]